MTHYRYRKACSDCRGGVPCTREPLGHAGVMSRDQRMAEQLLGLSQMLTWALEEDRGRTAVVQDVAIELHYIAAELEGLA